MGCVTKEERGYRGPFVSAKGWKQSIKTGSLLKAGVEGAT
jgi:hypothetical protein